MAEPKKVNAELIGSLPDAGPIGFAGNISSSLLAQASAARCRELQYAIVAC
jgi:hypothetical protein